MMLTVYPPEIPLAGLGTAEVFLVSTLRLWIHSRHTADPNLEWSEGFRQARLDAQATQSFDILCRIVATSAPRALDIRPLHCGHLGADEARLLQVTALLQIDRPADAEAVLRRICPPCAARIAVSHASLFAAALEARQLRILLSRLPCAATVQLGTARSARLQ